MSKKIDLSAYNRNNGIISGYKTPLQWQREEFELGNCRADQISHHPLPQEEKWPRHLPISNPGLPSSLIGIHHRRMDRFSDEKHRLIEQTAKDGHLTDEEAIHHYLYGNGETITVDATRLLVYQKKNWNSEMWAKGIVQGDNDFKVHGKLDMFLKADGSIEIKRGLYDYAWEERSNIARNLGTVARRELIGRGKDYWIEYNGTPRITREGADYVSSMFGN